MNAPFAVPRAAALVLLVVAPSFLPAQPGAVFPAVTWAHHEDPAAVGYDPDRLAAVVARASELATTGLMVVVGGEVLLSHGDTAQVSYVASVRKSILSLLFGKHVADGTVDLGATLGELGMTDGNRLSESELEATVEHLLTARSGVYRPASNPGDNSADAPERGSQPPGAYFLYNNWDFNAAGAAFERQTGVDIFDALRDDLAVPLQMQDFDRARHRKSGDLTKSEYPAYHMHFSTRDMARIGYLALRGGRWGEDQVVPEAWVERSTRVATPVEEMNPERLRRAPFGYGYMWWAWDGAHASEFAGAYTAAGAFGQYITVLPALDMVVAHKTAVPPVRNTQMRDFLALVDQIVAARAQDDLAARVERYLMPLVNARLFSGSVLLTRGGEVLVEAAFGQADFEAEQPYRQDTTSKLMSVTKPITATAVLRLVQDGALGLDDAVAEHLKPWPEAWAGITVRHLLSHTAGLQSFEPDWTIFAGGSPKARTLAGWPEFAERVAAREPDHPPGEQTRYSNMHYVLLGLVLEAVTGQSYADALRALVLDPAGMQQTGLDRGGQVDGQAVGYFLGPRGTLRASQQDMSRIAGAGGLYLHVRDLYKLDRALVAGTLLGDLPADRDLGWNATPVLGRRCLSHSGGSNGYVADLLRFPDDDACVVVLSNLAFAPVGRISRDLARLLFDQPVAQPRPCTPAQLSAYPGVYRSPDVQDRALVVRRWGTALMAFEVRPGVERCGAWPLVQVGVDRFAPRWGDQDLVFDEPKATFALGKERFVRAEPEPWGDVDDTYDTGNPRAHALQLVESEAGALSLRAPGTWPPSLQLLRIHRGLALALYSEDFGTLLHAERDADGVVQRLRWQRNDGLTLEAVRR